MNDYKELVAELRKWQTLGDAPVGNGFGVIVDKLTLKQAADAIEQLVKERDAAVADLTDTAMHGECVACKYFDRSDNVFCQECRLHSDSRWEWRGVQEADNE